MGLPQIRHPDELPRLPFRVVRPEGDDDGAPPPRVATGDDGGLSPRMTLSQFFERWFLPIVLMSQRKADAATVAAYRDSVKHWSKLTGDPPLEAIDEFTLARFDAALGETTFRRGLGGKERPLAEHTQKKHLRHVRAVLFRCGPRGADPKRPSSGILNETPHLVISSATTLRTKPCFSAAQARQIFAACDGLTAFGVGGRGCVHRRGDGGAGADDRWRALIGLLYYTGLRIGTLRGLEWSMIIRRDGPDDGDAFFDCPARIMKNKRPIQKFVHPDALRLVERLPREEARVLPFLSRHSETHLLDRHDWLQRLAGVRTPLSFHAWRRTHGDQMVELGMDRALWLGQQTLAHGDPETTRRYYVEVEPKFIRRLPPLTAPGDDDPHQRTLF